MEPLLRYSGSAQALLRLCPGSAPATHPWLRYAHPQLRLKQQLSVQRNGDSRGRIHGDGLRVPVKARYICN